MQANPFQNEIDELVRRQKEAYKAAAETEDVKAGNCTADDERQEPGFILYNQISKNVIEILNKPEVAKVFANIGKVMGDELSKEFISVIALSMSVSAHNAITFYDSLLKKELDAQFDNIGHHINLCKADIVGHQSVLEVFKKRLDEIEKQNKINKFAKDTGINPDE